MPRPLGVDGDAAGGGSPAPAALNAVQRCKSYQLPTAPASQGRAA